MEKLLHLYKYVDGKNDAPFPSKEQQAILFEFKYDAKRMGNAPTITGTLMHPLCLDELWGNNEVYVSYNGEKYFLKQTPTSSYSNEDTRYKHECDFVSERVLLNDVYFYDVVTSDVSNDKPVSNSSNVIFYGDIHELAKRLNYSLQYANLEYSVVVDEGITSESKLVSFQKQFFANVLQEGYKLFEIPYYFDGKVIHFGYTNNSIDKVFSYGAKDALLSISKNNITQRIINRITGVGSADNIPYYYPNFDAKGESEVLYNGVTSDSLSIENLIKYKKVKLGDTFFYTYESDKRIEYINKDKYIISKEPTLISENYESSKRYEVILDFPFNVEIAQDATIELDYGKANLSNFQARLYRNLELKERFTSFGTIPTYTLIEGDYNFSITLEFEFKEGDEKQELTSEDIPSIVDALVLSIYANVEGYEQWSLNKESNKVSLSDYGLKLNVSPKNGDKITFRQVSYIPPQPNLMPPIYRETLGAERFYNALNDTYYNSDNNAFYSFENPFIKGKNKEDDVSFEDIKPSIKGVTNANGLRIDMFSEFAYDLEDNDEFDEEGNYLHPYFFGKLRKFDGDFGFNLFDHTIEEDEMVISMTSGSCGGCNFIIGVDNQQQKNIVQVDENGNLKRDANGNVLYGSPQERQNDTRNYEVWVALKKDIETFGVIMPNATNNYRPSASDTFVILHIDLPNAYILASEERLKEELIKYMANNNSEKFNFSLSFSRIFFADNPTILAQLNENARIKIAYNNNIYTLYVSSYSYSMSSDSSLPEVRVELSEELAIIRESIVKQLANASRYLNYEITKINSNIVNTNIDFAKKSSIAKDSITQTNTRVDNVEKILMTVQGQGSSGSGEGGGYNLLESWEFYDENKREALGANLGYELKQDLEEGLTWDEYKDGEGGGGSSEPNEGVVSETKLVKYITDYVEYLGLKYVEDGDYLKATKPIVSEEEIISLSRANKTESDAGGDTGEGITEITSEMIIKALGYTPYDANNPQGFITSSGLDSYAKREDIPSLEGYATQTWVSQQGFLTQHQDLSAYAKKTDIPSLNGYATQSWVENKKYLTFVPSEYVTETELIAKGYATASDVQVISTQLSSLEGRFESHLQAYNAFVEQQQTVANGFNDRLNELEAFELSLETIDETTYLRSKYTFVSDNEIIASRKS